MMWLEALQRLIAAQNKIKVWREYRGLTQTDLAKQVGVSQSTIALLESGKHVGTLALFNGLAEALNLELDDLI
jgi:DNA-binding XRE family transcriptional regulator